MAEPDALEYFYGTEAEQYTFYRIPKVLFTDPGFKQTTGDAKILYGLIWIIQSCRSFIYYIDYLLKGLHTLEFHVLFLFNVLPHIFPSCFLYINLEIAKLFYQCHYIIIRQNCNIFS